MKNKYIFGGIIIAIFFIALGFLFTKTNIKYEEDFSKIRHSGKIVKVTGSWDKDKNYTVDSKHNRFIFYLRNEQGDEMKVVYKGTIPNNFEHATSVVVTGKFKDGVFHAKEILTKCPSKYQEAENNNAPSS